MLLAVKMTILMRHQSTSQLGLQQTGHELVSMKTSVKNK